MRVIILLFILINLSCSAQDSKVKKQAIKFNKNLNFDTTIKTIHVFVALCDNVHQGIVPVPAKIGNGKDYANNLYWGCKYGVYSFFKASAQWQFVSCTKINDTILQRAIFKHKNTNTYLIADAYEGSSIKLATEHFLAACAGQEGQTININNKIIGCNGIANCISFIGHDGLMDFKIEKQFNAIDNKKRDALIFACYSKHYFATHLKFTKANPLIWSTGLMSPEAYSLHDGLEIYLQNGNENAVQQACAKSYSKYQKCSIKASSRLLTTGW